MAWVFVMYEAPCEVIYSFGGLHCTCTCSSAVVALATRTNKQQRQQQQTTNRMALRENARFPTLRSSGLARTVAPATGFVDGDERTGGVFWRARL
jgi:hypothetical protein